MRRGCGFDGPAGKTTKISIALNGGRGIAARISRINVYFLIKIFRTLGKDYFCVMHELYLFFFFRVYSSGSFGMLKKF